MSEDIQELNVVVSEGVHEVTLDDGAVVKLYAGCMYAGGPLSKSEIEERLVRKALGLPVTKQLVYYPDKKDKASAVKVTVYQLIEMYAITDRWYTVELILDNGNRVRIHSDYLVEMQKPSFVADMAKQASQI